ncbi:hypothetical protein BABA_11981 [Neobacillus bataviensis LMG 21833]|uniref:Uncharacterized protein n=1 Tax=Neobacillus bataviensis LMG 21833 TaxID=1117379 RepID=K6E666_9BACI|nr:hypothetical protein [Neobacillus bataviensis]EKN68771.1 hypothetical protein BABA_11981 [Neobacillus bataviensis LMG 21833]
MAGKKENEKELEKAAEKDSHVASPAAEANIVNEAIENKEEVPVLEANSAVEKTVEKDDSEEQLSSLDILWCTAFGELDEWASRADYRDEVFLNKANLFAESVQRNQGNAIEIAAQFYQEFSAWEKTAREEFLMSTTSLQHFFPLKSYEDINGKIDQVQEKTLAMLVTPCQKVASNLSMDKYLELIDQYITLRKKGREQYIKTVKQAGSLIYENQKGFVNLFARQIKTLMFPLNKYLEKTEELTK